METNNLLQPWRKQFISLCFLPSTLCKLTHRGMASQKLCSLFPICCWKAKQAVKLGLHSLEVPGGIRGSQPLPVPWILERVFSSPPSEWGWYQNWWCRWRMSFIPSLMVFFSPCPHEWDHAAIRAAEDTGEGFGAHSSNDPQRETSHGLVLSCDLGAYACI